MLKTRPIFDTLPCENYSEISGSPTTGIHLMVVHCAAAERGVGLLIKENEGTTAAFVKVFRHVVFF